MALPTPRVRSTKGIGKTMRRVASLAFVAGYLNAVGFLDLGGIFPAAMTGNTVQLSLAIVKMQWSPVFLVGGTVASFVFGAVVSSYLQRRLAKPALELSLMALLVLIAQLVRLDTSNPIALELPLLACALAMQGETISRFSGAALQTIVVTTSLLRFADGMVGRYLCAGGRKQTALIDIALPGSAWLAYLVGAGFGVVTNLFTPIALLPPALILFATSADLAYAPETAERTQ